MKTALIILALIAATVGLVLRSRAAYRQIDADFPEHSGIGAADVETIRRNERNV